LRQLVSPHGIRMMARARRLELEAEAEVEARRLSEAAATATAAEVEAAAQAEAEAEAEAERNAFGLLADARQVVTVALNGQDYVTAEREVVVCNLQLLRCTEKASDAVHATRNDASAAGLTRHCRNESACSGSAATCETTAEEVCTGWKPLPAMEDALSLCQPRQRCQPEGHEACARVERCTHCSLLTQCATYTTPAAAFRYYDVRQP
jgi:hypothetical protein